MFDKAVVETREKCVDNILLFGADKPGVEFHGIAEDHYRDTKMEAPMYHVVPSHASRRRLQDKQYDWMRERERERLRLIHY